MFYISHEDGDAVELIEAIQKGDIDTLRRIFDEDSELAETMITIEDDKSGRQARTLLHVATDWPGHYPDVAKTIQFLVEAGADVNAPFEGAHTETPLHWAASSNDVAALDALLDSGADIEADGAVIGGLTPMADAVAFAQWKAARRLLERGAKTTFAQSAALGLIDRLENITPSLEEINAGFWYACHGGQQAAAEYLLGLGADINWLAPWEHLTAIDAAKRSQAIDLADWLRSKGARPALRLV